MIDIVKDHLKALYGAQVPGVVFYVTRNGKPFADGCFGWARMPGALEGELEMSSNTLVHIASVGKFFCAVAILRLIEEWNRIFDLGQIVDRNGRLMFPPGLNSFDRGLYQTVWRLNTRLTLQSYMYYVIEPWLDHEMILRFQARPGGYFPGNKVKEATLLQMLTHKSSLFNGYDETDLAPLTNNDVNWEPPDESPTRFDSKKVITAMLHKDATVNPPDSYNQAAFVILGGLIEAATSKTYSVWVHEKLFNHQRFKDLSRKVISRARAARYYSLQNGSFTVGNRHPDYTNFAANGGWYVSASQFCDWLDALMQKEKVWAPASSQAILENPEPLLSEMLGLANPSFKLSRLQEWSKNGGTGPGGGETNAVMMYLKGYGNERLCAFAQANARVQADSVVWDGMRAVRNDFFRPGPIPSPIPSGTAGLLQAVYWEEDGAVKSASKIGKPKLKTVSVGGAPAKSRTNMFGDGLAGGKSLSDSCTVELRGMINIASAGSYRFRLSSHDGSLLWINDQLRVDHDGAHSLSSKESDAFQLDVGWFPIRIGWYNATGDSGSLFLEWLTPTSSDYEAIPSANFIT